MQRSLVRCCTSATCLESAVRCQETSLERWHSPELAGKPLEKEVPGKPSMERCDTNKAHYRAPQASLPQQVSLWDHKGFCRGSAGKESACSAGDLGSIPGLGRSPGEGKGFPLQYSGLENSMDHIIHGVAKSQTRLSNFHFHFPQGPGAAHRREHGRTWREAPSSRASPVYSINKD